MTVHIDKNNFLTLSQINAQLEIVNATAAGLDELGVKPAYIVGNARYYPKDAADQAAKAIARHFVSKASLHTITEPGESRVQTCFCSKRQPSEPKGDSHV